MNSISLTKMFDLENDGLNMATDGQFLFIRCKRVIYKYSLSDMSQVEQNVLFKKDGKARSLSVFDKYVLLTDFCNLHILNKGDLQELVHGKLIEIDKSDMRVNRKTELSKNKNIYSVLFNGGLLYMVSQDRTIKVVDITSLEVVNIA